MGKKIIYLLAGMALPLAAYLVWMKTDGFRWCSRKAHVDEMHDITVEDSFPASDPPSAW